MTKLYAMIITLAVMITPMSFTQDRPDTRWDVWVSIEACTGTVTRSGQNLAVIVDDQTVAALNEPGDVWSTEGPATFTVVAFAVEQPSVVVGERTFKVPGGCDTTTTTAAPTTTTTEPPTTTTTEPPDITTTTVAPCDEFTSCDTSTTSTIPATTFTPDVLVGCGPADANGYSADVYYEAALPIGDHTVTYTGGSTNYEITEADLETGFLFSTVGESFSREGMVVFQAAVGGWATSLNVSECGVEPDEPVVDVPKDEVTVVTGDNPDELPATGFQLDEALAAGVMMVMAGAGGLLLERAMRRREDTV